MCVATSNTILVYNDKDIADVMYLFEQSKIKCPNLALSDNMSRLNVDQMVIFSPHEKKNERLSLQT
jgi:hypothetical protein